MKIAYESTLSGDFAHHAFKIVSRGDIEDGQPATEQKSEPGGQIALVAKVSDQKAAARRDCRRRAIKGMERV